MFYKAIMLAASDLTMCVYIYLNFLLWSDQFVLYHATVHFLISQETSERASKFEVGVACYRFL